MGILAILGFLFKLYIAFWIFIILLWVLVKVLQGLAFVVGELLSIFD